MKTIAVTVVAILVLAGCATVQPPQPPTGAVWGFLASPADTPPGVEAAVFG
jgi:hypothetical protein